MSAERRRYVLNSAVIPGPGTYDYRLVSASFARAWLTDTLSDPYVSLVRYDATLDAMQRVVGERPSMAKQSADGSYERARLRPGDEALVFRLKMRVTGAPLDLRRYTDQQLLDLSEIGLLRRVA